jgi:hypothetical protein
MMPGSSGGAGFSIHPSFFFAFVLSGHIYPIFQGSFTTISPGFHRLDGGW